MASDETDSRRSGSFSSSSFSFDSFPEPSVAFKFVALTRAAFSNGVDAPEDVVDDPSPVTVLFRLRPAGFGFVGGGGDLARLPFEDGLVFELEDAAGGLEGGVDGVTLPLVPVTDLLRLSKEGEAVESFVGELGGDRFEMAFALALRVCKGIVWLLWIPEFGNGGVGRGGGGGGGGTPSSSAVRVPYCPASELDTGPCRFASSDTTPAIFDATGEDEDDALGSSSVSGGVGGRGRVGARARGIFSSTLFVSSN